MDLVREKKNLRRKAFAALKAMSPSAKVQGSNRICEELKSLEEFQLAKTVFAYLPLPSEPDLTSLFDHNRSWGFARVLGDDEMEFREMCSLSDAIEGKFKIREPNPETCPVLKPENADLVIIPGVGFCPTTGARLGRGKGHYDRYLEPILKRENPPLLIGVCFAVQRYDVKAEAHDIPMDKVVFG